MPLDAAAPAAIAVRRVTVTDDPALPRLQRLYEAHIPETERERWELLAGQCAAGAAVMFCAEAGDSAVGFAHFLLLPRSETALLLYTVAQGRPGTGSVMMAQARRYLPQIGVREVVGEIDRVEDAGSAADARRRGQRLTLYRRWGGRRLPVAHYAMPNLQGRGDEHVPMHLYWFSIDERAVAPTGARLASLITEIFARAYGRDEEDLLLRHVLSSI